jgi:uncharacterized membrane protein
MSATNTFNPPPSLEAPGRAAAPAEERARSEAAARQTNVHEVERWASVLGGTALTLFGASRRSPGGTALALLGGYFVYRGATGHCPAYQALGAGTADTRRSARATVQASRAVKVCKSITINRPADELYHFWHAFENLPRITDHLESVTALGPGRWHWVAKAPGGQRVEWDAEVINDQAGELIAWQSLPGSQIPNAGSVQFKPAPGGRGTVVTLKFDYHPPAGGLAHTLTKLSGENPEHQVEDALHRFKQLMEAGEIATTQG